MYTAHSRDPDLLVRTSGMMILYDSFIFPKTNNDFINSLNFNLESYVNSVHCFCSELFTPFFSLYFLVTPMQ
jgi:hypothetical protein